MVLHVSSQPNMATETLQMSRLANGEAESSHHRKSDQTPHQAVNGRRFGNLGSEGASARPCSDENGREATDVIRKKAKRQKGMTFQDMYSNQGLFDEEDDDDSDWEPPQVQRTSQMALQRKAKQQKEMTFQDMYNNQGLFDEDDDDDDGDWEPAQEQHTSQMALQNKAKQQKEMTFQDMYNNQGLFDEDDDDDGDWEPAQEHVETGKWFCTNCTMVNLDDVTHCDICGEHKESGILRHGFFASPFSHDVGRPVEAEHEIKGHKDLGSQIPTSNSSTAVGFDERMLLHSEVEMKPHPHPERPDRLRAIAASLATAGIFPGRCYPISAREITKEELQMVHSVEHIETVELTSHILSSYFTPDTYANEHSARAARLAAGLCADLATEIFSGRAKNGFALVRPPGHHAGVRQAMGFCLHNNAAVAALAAQVAGAKKVLIVDWDVHHGNGTQEIFDRNKSVLYISLHRHEGGKFYPGTGAALEVGTMGAEGYCVNIPWSCGGVGDNDYIFAFQHIVLPIASEFAPDFTIISAGFDAARGDPLGCCDVTPAGYALMTHMLYALSSGKLLVILEGGYNLRSISSSATAVIKVLLGESPGCNLDNVLPSKAGALTVLEVLKIQMNFWPTLGSRFSDLQAQWGMYCLKNKKNRIKKRRRAVAPLWWKWGQKSLLYHLLNRHLHIKSKRC